MDSAYIIDGVPRETSERLAVFAKALQRWNGAINLISRASTEQLWDRHISDSLQLFRFRPHGPAHWVDIGTGGGFPGLVLAIAAHDQAPNLRFTLVESDTRKAAFLQAAARETDTVVTIKNARAELLEPMEADIVSARALASLTNLLELQHKHARPSGRGLFLKGRAHGREIEQALESWQFEVQEHASLTDPSGVILEINGVTRV